MKRPLALLGFTALIALGLGSAFGAPAAGVMALVCGGAGLGLVLVLTLRAVWRRRQGLPRKGIRFLSALTAVLLTAAVFFGMFTAAVSRRVTPYEALAGERVYLRGQVLDYPEKAYGRAYYTFRVERVRQNGQTLDLKPFTVRLSCWQPLDIEPYDLLECDARLYAFSTSGGLYSTANSRLADGVVLGAYLSGGSVTVPSPGMSPAEMAVRLREWLGRRFDKLLPARESGMIRAILLGQRERVEDSIYSGFQNIGASHLLVISGLHMTALAWLLRSIFGRLPVRRWARNAFTAAALLCFLAVIGFPVSAVRSGIMYLVLLAADSLGREPDGVNSLGFAVLVICVFNPFAGGDLGFALSVTSTLGILLFASDIRRGMLSLFEGRKVLGRMAVPAAVSFGMTFGALLGTLPIQMLVFRGFPLITPLANLVLVFPTQLLLYFSLMGAVLNLLPLFQPVSLPFVLCAGWLARLVLALEKLLNRLPSLFLDLSQPVWLMCLGFTLLLLTALFLRKTRGVALAVLAGAVMVWGCGWGLNAFAYRGVITAAVAEDSSCVVVFKGDRAAVLSLGGFQTDAAADLLRRNNIRRVETICLNRQDTEAIEAAEQVLKGYPVETLFLPEGAYADRRLALAESDTPILFLSDGGSFKIFGDVTVTARYHMGRLDFTVYGVPVMIESAETDGGVCGVLFTDRPQSEITANLTVFQSEEEFAALLNEEDLSAGQYLLAGREGLYIDFYPDGRLDFRGETDA